MIEPRHDTTRDTMDHTTPHDVVSVPAAAIALGITEDAVRARLRRGSLAGEKQGDTWHIPRSALNAARDTNATRHDVARSHDTTTRDTTGHATRHDTTPAVDLAPLAELIERQARDLIAAREAAAVWQVRALQAEERLQQLTAGGDDVSVSEPTAPETETPPQDAPSEPPRLWHRLRQWLRGPA